MSIKHNFSVADHLVVDRGFYEHHGIYVGHGSVIHYDSTNGSKLLRHGIVRKTSIEKFARGQKIYVRQYRKALPPHIVLQRVRSKLGEQKYNLWANNCEHFALWAKTGQAKSSQVNTVKVVGTVASVLLAIGLIFRR